MSRAPAQEEILVTVSRPLFQGLGVVTDKGDGETLCVREIKSGVIADWNEKNPDQLVEDGDRIAAVNDASGSVDALVEEIKHSEVLHLQVRKAQELPAAPSATWRPAKRSVAVPTSAPGLKRPLLAQEEFREEEEEEQQEQAEEQEEKQGEEAWQEEEQEEEQQEQNEEEEPWQEEQQGWDPMDDQEQDPSKIFRPKSLKQGILLPKTKSAPRPAAAAGWTESIPDSAAADEDPWEEEILDNEEEYMGEDSGGGAKNKKNRREKQAKTKMAQVRQPPPWQRRPGAAQRDGGADGGEAGAEAIAQAGKGRAAKRRRKRA